MMVKLAEKDNAKERRRAQAAKLVERKRKRLAAERAKREISDKALLALWREVVALRAGDRCEVCGAERPQGKNGCIHHHAHHIYSRRIYSLRYEPLNGLYLCASCHDFPRVGGWSAHTHPILFSEWVKKNIAKKRLAMLREKSLKTVKRNHVDRRAIREELLAAIEKKKKKKREKNAE